MAEKARYWTVVCYPENMIPDWKDQIAHLLQVPFAYCLHDKDHLLDSEVDRKDHLHIELAFSNTTTYNHVCDVLSKLNLPGHQCFNKIESVIDVRYMYNYLIHDTDDCRKKGKYLYDITERILCNNFDIGDYEQLSSTRKNECIKELCSYIINNQISNFADFYSDLIAVYGDESDFFEVFKSYSSIFERLTKAIYQKLYKKKIDNDLELKNTIKNQIHHHKQQ